MYNNFEISLVVFIPNITTNHAITYTNFVNNHVVHSYNTRRYNDLRFPLPRTGEDKHLSKKSNDLLLGNLNHITVVYRKVLIKSYNCNRKKH